MNTIIGILVFLFLLVPRTILSVVGLELFRTVVDNWRYESLRKKSDRLKEQLEALEGATLARPNEAARLLFDALYRKREQSIEGRDREALALEQYAEAAAIGIWSEAMREHRSLKRGFEMDILEIDAQLRTCLDDERRRLIREIERIEKLKDRYERFQISTK